MHSGSSLYTSAAIQPCLGKARKRFAQPGALIEQDLRMSEMDEAKQRWAHLVPELPYERKIREMQAAPEWPQIRAELIKASHNSRADS